MLTHTQVERAKYVEGGPNRLWDGRGSGLFLQLTPKSKLWRMKFVLDGRESTFSIGRFPLVSLQEAREACDKARALIAKGVNPTRAKQQAAQQRFAEARATFRSVAEEWIDDKRPEWTESYCRQIEGIFKHHVYPALGTLAIKDIDPAAIRQLLRRIERGDRLRYSKRSSGSPRTATARLARMWCSQVFRLAVTTGRCSVDPTAVLGKMFERYRATPKKALNEVEIREFLVALGGAPVERPTAIALELLLLLWTRPGELRNASWPEFVLDGPQPFWKIPAHRMKMRTEHVVPLSARAVELLRELRFSQTGEPFLLFPNRRKPKMCMSATTLNRALERMGYAGRFSAHGFRATGSTAMNARNYPSDWIEFQLAHQERDESRRPYQQGNFLDQRRMMMNQWADLIDASRAGRPWPVPNALTIIPGGASTANLQSAPRLVAVA